MCKVCGCAEGDVRIEGAASHSRHHHAHDHHHHSHDHRDGLGHGHPRGDGHIHFGLGRAGAAVAGISEDRLVTIEQDILAHNAGFAAENRRRLAASGILALNLVSSPGSGKTTLLVKTIEALSDRAPVAVIEGDQETSKDAERIRGTGVPAIQVNTGRGCHLDAHMVGHAMDGLPLARGAILFIENVGNLVCPAGFDLGEAAKVVILSVTEGDDKPLKYPDAFAAASLLILTKTDLLPHVDFDAAGAIANARAINPSLEVLEVSARTGQGMEDWIAWLLHARDHARDPHLAGAHAHA
jgi:hydrogenase nickel incorporation protein HypB